MTVGVIILIVIALLFLLSLQRQKVTAEKDVIDTVSLSKYANSDATVSFMTEGSIVGADMHRSIKMTISKHSRIIEILEGYQYIPIKSQVYVNNPEAYQPFLAALQGAGFTKKKEKSPNYQSGR